MENVIKEWKGKSGDSVWEVVLRKEVFELLVEVIKVFLVICYVGLLLCIEIY